MQVHAVSTSQAYQSSMLRPDVAARLQAQMSVNVTELAAAKWVFGLLDFDNDGESVGDPWGDSLAGDVCGVQGGAVPGRAGLPLLHRVSSNAVAFAQPLEAAGG